MYGNGRPLGLRKRMQVVIAVVLLAWATQTLLHQWGFGAEIVPPPEEHFAPGSDRFVSGATLEIRGDATIYGGEVKLRQICRWSDADKQVFAPMADLVIARIDAKRPFKSISIDQIRNALRGAGVNMAVLRFAGPMTCTLTRSDGEADEQTALAQWASAKQETDSPPPAQAAVVAIPAAASLPAFRGNPKASPDAALGRSLSSILTDDLAVRLGIPADQLQMTFSPQDESVLRLTEPLFKFNIVNRQAMSLGQVSWDVQIITGGKAQKAAINAFARAWQNQLVVAKPMGYHQVIRSEDLKEQRVLVEQMPAEPLVNSSQVVGQEAARDLNAGTVVSSRMVDPVTLVKPGQLVTISVNVGQISVKTVGRAMEAGTFGQAVKVRNESTQDVYEVTITGPQEGTVSPPSSVGISK
jgi:flagella basal body P-ring formation protein FlgA